MIAPGNNCIERFAALCNTLPYVPLPARTWHLRSTLTALDYRLPAYLWQGLRAPCPAVFIRTHPAWQKSEHFCHAQDVG